MNSLPRRLIYYFVDYQNVNERTETIYRLHKSIELAYEEVNEQLKEYQVDIQISLEEVILTFKDRAHVLIHRSKEGSWYIHEAGYWNYEGIDYHLTK